MFKIEAKNFYKAIETEKTARGQAKSEMPVSHFTLISIDNESIHFRVVAKMSEIDDRQIKDIKEKTRFYFLIEEIEDNVGIYTAHFKMFLYP